MNPTPTSQQWALLRRMRTAGCPIDYRHLTLPSRPLAVVNHPLTLTNGSATNIFRRYGQTWITLYVEISVASTVGIRDLHLRAHWLAQEAALLKPCPEHPQNYCLPLNPGGRHCGIPSDRVLNRWSRKKGILSRGVHTEGYILARGTDFLATTRHRSLHRRLVGARDGVFGGPGKQSGARLKRRKVDADCGLGFGYLAPNKFKQPSSGFG